MIWDTLLTLLAKLDTVVLVKNESGGGIVDSYPPKPWNLILQTGAGS